MNTLTITNVQDLKHEIYRLRRLDDEQEAALTVRFSSPSAIFSVARTLFPTSGAADPETTRPDYVSLISRFLIPLVLTKTIFRHSNFLVKALVGLGARKASGYVTESVLVKAVYKGKMLVHKLFHKNDQRKNIGLSKYPHR